MRSYNRTLLLTALLILPTVFAVNAVLDPFWYFGTTHFLNTHKFSFDERVQKTNHLMNTDQRYDALLLGSSRVTIMDTKLFRHNSLFNCGLSGIYPDEYEGYIALARLRHPLSRVYIGLDFYGTNQNKLFQPNDPLQKNKDGATSTLRRLMALISSDGLKYSFLSARLSLWEHNDSEYYDTSYVKHLAPLSSGQQRTATLQHLRIFHEKAYGPNYRWNSALPELLRTLRKRHPDIRFVVFTTPISAPMFSLLIRDGRLPDYERWLRLMVEQFGSVLDFMGLNSVTQIPNNYTDGHHFRAEVGADIADRLEGRDSGVPMDFGVLVTARNINEHLADIRRQAEHADPDPIRTLTNSIHTPDGNARPVGK